MLFNLKTLAQLGEARPDVLLLRAGEAWPEQLAAFEPLFDAEQPAPSNPDHPQQAVSQVLRFAEADKVQELAVLCLPADSSINQMQKDVTGFYKEIQTLKTKEPKVLLSSDFPDETVIQLIKTLVLADDEFTCYHSSGHTNSLEDQTTKADEKKLKAIHFYLDSDHTTKLEQTARNLAEILHKTRELVNQPACYMTPTKLSEEAQAMGEKYGFEVAVYGPQEIQSMGLKAYWQVARGSDEEPRFIVMQYNNCPQSPKKLALVGKGLCYDSGGYDIKPGSGMRTMHTDMGGSAAVIGAISALAAEQAKVNVVAIVAACENMVSGHAYRNGDIISSLAGKNIEIVSTDAEGRLTLADAVCYAWKEEKATCIVDIATLTGAVGVALGNHFSGCLADQDELYEAAQTASALCGDKIWRLPIDDEFIDYNKSQRADIKNGGGRPGGCITAGLFVRAFANGVPFMHFDIAYTSYNEEGTKRSPKGATGVGAELLYYFAREHFQA